MDVKQFSHGLGGTLAGLSAPDWCKLQHQSRGSYRTEDVLNFLDWALPAAESEQDSAVVMLDWFSAHLAEEVQALVRAKGHVLLYHGGGTTGIEQINEARPDVFFLWDGKMRSSGGFVPLGAVALSPPYTNGWFCPPWGGGFVPPLYTNMGTYVRT